jgi:predicted Zn-ribbon and HTH transcriptional regulator
MAQCKCQRCGYSWRSQIDPQSCPRCKSYQWKVPRKKPRRKGDVRNVA